VSHDDDDAPTPPDVVDFDALHAALGELPPPPTSSSPSIGESQGRSSATYSSARPHTIPPTRAPVAAELNAPPVIVQTEDTAPTGPPQKMTVPMTGAPYRGDRGAGAPMPPGLARPENPPRQFGPEPFAASAVPPGMDARALPMPPPRRPRTPTIVVRTRGPTKQQKLLVFMAMLIVFVGGGIAFLVYGKQLGIDIDLERPPPRPTATATATATAPAMAPTTPAPAPTPTVSGALSATTAVTGSAATPTALPTASATPSAKKAPRRAAPPPPTSQIP